MKAHVEAPVAGETGAGEKEQATPIAKAGSEPIDSEPFVVPEPIDPSL